MQKIKASLYHFILSLILVILIIGSVLLLFFPTLYLGITDFKEITLIILSVDLILGPLLTFVVFRPDKKKRDLLIDFSVIGMLQLTALAYGAYSLYQVHPVYITFNVDRFTVISAKDVEPDKAVFDEYKVSKLSSATLAYAELPKKLEKQNDLLFRVIETGEDLDRREEYYKPYLDNLPNIITKELDPKKILEKIDNRNKIETFLTNEKDIEAYSFLPINTETKYAIIVLNRNTGQPVTILDIDPWEL